MSDSIEPWLAEHLARRRNLDCAAEFRDACPVPGASVEAYLPRVIESRGARALVGARFYGGDPERPFVDIIALDRALRSGAERALADAAARAFAPLGPASARLVRWSEADAAPPPVPDDVEIDQWLVAGEVAPAPISADLLARTGADALDTADHVIGAWYKGWERAAPWRNGATFCADRDDLERCAAHGALVLLERAGVPVGVAGAAPEREPTTGVQGFCVVEQVVDPKHAGAGLGRASQAALHTALARRHPGALLWGTIDARNGASLRTALGSGRRIVARFEFWPVFAPRADP